MAKRNLEHSFRLTRRRFAFWVGLGIFTAGEKLNARTFDYLAALGMRLAPTVPGTIQQPQQDPQSVQQSQQVPEHWLRAESSVWRWYERERLVAGKWVLTGRTTPVHKLTGKPVQGEAGYLDESLVPELVRVGRDLPPEQEQVSTPGQVSVSRRARHGRPPSKWLRSLEADEIRTWLKTIEVPETGVSGMTFWTHLTRDHSFDPEKIEGLTEEEQAKLHSAAHYGY